MGNPLKDSGETLISAGNRFELGFFTPQGNDKSNKRYVGIWYYELTPRTIVWVANRDKSISGSYGVFGIAEDGNLKIWCNNGYRSPITNLEMSTTFSRKLQLLDSGNLILLDGNATVWQSFDSPTDTFLPGMKMKDNMELTSWMSPGDPRTGNYRFHRDQVWFEPRNFCSEYDVRGKFGICNTTNKPTCQCLQGFRPTSSEDWAAGTSSDGCERETRHTKDDRFLNLTLMKIGGQVTSFDQAQEEATCRNQCLSRLKCEAYIYKANVSEIETDNFDAKCYIWTDLENLQIDYTDDGFNLSLRVPFSYIGQPNSKNNSRRISAIVLTFSLVGVVLVFCSSYILHRRWRMANGSGKHIRDNTTF
ncbi:Non-specific serine/threonine protein kinase [Handroanthus impetiginosus]|uniref:Non-specific serine/threonine protein kinase n=1 Tax=Handroanthus impetiginosus TaxID=429701 RepID=A0A2G9H9N3_9LAMI|nr:Non-specific serine/threonine protein kinase [Handroanthus impetiginosus]